MSQTPRATLAPRARNGRKLRRFLASPLAGGCAKAPEIDVIEPDFAAFEPLLVGIEPDSGKNRGRLIRRKP
jgi:hypothetical protein